MRELGRILRLFSHRTLPFEILNVINRLNSAEVGDVLRKLQCFQVYGNGPWLAFRPVLEMYLDPMVAVRGQGAKPAGGWYSRNGVR